MVQCCLQYSHRCSPALSQSVVADEYASVAASGFAAVALVHVAAAVDAAQPVSAGTQ